MAISTIYTQSHLDALDKAIAAGLRKVEFEDRTVVFPTLGEMLAARAHVASVLAAVSIESSGATPVPRQTRMKTNSGY